MASITSLTFDEAAYNTGDTISLTVAYVADTPSVVPTEFTATTTITDAGGNETATSSAPFTVNVAQAAGDVVATTDTGGRAWTEVSDDGSTAVFTAVA